MTRDVSVLDQADIIDELLEPRGFEINPPAQPERGTIRVLTMKAPPLR